MKIEEYLGTEKIFFASSGSMVIFSVLYPFREKILGIPDQGCFGGIMKIADLLNMKYRFIETDDGIIIPENIKNVDIFFFSSFSGYLVENNVEDICTHCKKNGILSMEDISSGFSYPEFGKGDIIVCSTGTPKILECGWGGFVAYRNIERSGIFDFMRMPEGYMEKLENEVKNSRFKLQRILKYSRILKDFDYDVLFRDHNGVSVFVKTEYAKKILKILNREIKPDTGKSLFTRCPRYDRVLEKGFVIETIKIWKRKEDEIIDIGRKIEKEIKCLNI